MAMTAAGFGLLALALSPAIAQPIERLVAKPRVSLSARGGLGSFTPADADPRLVAALARNSLTANGMRFTPVGASLRLNRSVTVAVRARANGTALGGDSTTLGVTSPAVGIAPVAYNLGAAIGWKRFALSGDVAKVDGVMGGREAVDLGVSYNTKKWSARVGVAADQPTALTPRPLADARGVSADLGGSYRLTRNLDVTAGVRYRATDRDRLNIRNDAVRDSQAVYVGTAFKF
ncbi:hypothetical protein [Sphingomonas antarctica]|uniref:hypothetical protein n=1 Tax=Sphingomonas antarctica TaxID=2040274 RepID=UPI0039E85534